MKNKKSLLAILLGLLAILFALLGEDFYQGQPYPSSEVQKVKVEEVIDGDTIRVRDIESDEIFRVRYLGIDTPELDGPYYESCFGSQAKEKNEDLVLDQNLLLEFDLEKKTSGSAPLKKRKPKTSIEVLANPHFYLKIFHL